VNLKRNIHFTKSTDTIYYNIEWKKVMTNYGKIFSFLLIQNEGKRLKNQYTKRQKTKLQKHASILKIFRK